MTLPIAPITQLGRASAVGLRPAGAERASRDPGAAVPVRLESAGVAPDVDVQLVRKAGDSDGHMKLEAFASADAAELFPSRRFARRDEPRDPAAAATPLQPHVESAAALGDQIEGRIGDDRPHD